MRFSVFVPEQAEHGRVGGGLREVGVGELADRPVRIRREIVGDLLRGALADGHRDETLQEVIEGEGTGCK